MRAKWHGAKVLALGVTLATSSLFLSTAGHAASAPEKHRVVHTSHVSHASHAGLRTAHAAARGHVRHVSYKHALSKSGKARYASHGGISCVPFARGASGIALKGNAANWWDAAAGVYERGSRPEAGSVLNFRATGHMRLGHVAVVTNVLGDREIEIDHANWSGLGASKGGVARGIRVEDVSAGNDWTEVRVALGHSEAFGSVYPTYGFIYDRPDDGTMVANIKPRLGPSDRALLNEVAEAPLPRTGMLDRLPVDAPDRSLR
jgi:surface antigen